MVTPQVLKKVVWAGVNNGSYAQAVTALAELAEFKISTKQVRRMVAEIGAARLAERAAEVACLQALPLPERRPIEGQFTALAPQLAVISVDGGRYQRRDNFQGQPKRDPAGKHWRETKVGVLLSMASTPHASDPAAEFPQWLASSAAVAELAKISEKRAAGGACSDDVGDAPQNPETTLYEPPKLLAREVLASSGDVEAFGWQLEAAARAGGFLQFQRQAFVADGTAANWGLARKHFPQAEPILDLMHGLSYAWSAADAVDCGVSYPRWAEWIWKGNVAQVIVELKENQQRLGPPPANVDASDPRARVDRTLTYYENQQTKMDYPRYRQAGLPLTSSHIESTIKQINQRIKGTEKFWCRDHGDAVLQLRADYLSDSRPLNAFWHRWLNQQDGSNRYQTAA